MTWVWCFSAKRGLNIKAQRELNIVHFSADLRPLRCYQCLLVISVLVLIILRWIHFILKKTCVLIQRNRQRVDQTSCLHCYISPLQPTYKEEMAARSRVLPTPASSNHSTISLQHLRRKPTPNPPISFLKKSDKSLLAQLEITS